MSLEKHTNIFFDNIKINNNIDFFKLWKETYKIVNPYKPLNFNNILNYIRIIKNLYLCKYFISTKDLDGDVLECGVLRGFSSYFLRLVEDRLSRNSKNNFFLIDSFEGLSEILEKDKPLNSKINQHKKGDLKADFTEVKKVFKKFNNVNLIKGWIPEVFNLLNKNNKYRFVHLDVDLYQPTLDSLNYVYDRVIKGGIIITDDYRSPIFPGNQIAWEEYFKSKNNNSFLSLPSGQAVFIKA